MTAVEWLIERYKNRCFLTVEDYQKAKEMEKEQIMDAFWNGDNTDCTSEQNSKEFAEQYYNKTFKSKEYGKRIRY
jgi:hypothetical protein